MSLIKWFHFQDYFDDQTLIVEQKRDPTHTIFICHPHGILPYGLSIALWTYDDVFFNATLLVTRMIIQAPFNGILHKLWNFDSVNSRIIVGGYEEQTINSYKENRIFIRNRKGFIKYALQYGYDIQSIFTYGDNKLYYTVDTLEGVGLILNKLKIPLCLCWPKYVVVPNSNIKMCCVVSKKMGLPKIMNPSNEEIEKYHKQYIQKLEEFYEKYFIQLNIDDPQRIY